MVLVVGVILVVVRMGKAVRMGMRVGAVLIRAAGLRAVTMGVFVIVVVHGAGVPRGRARVNGGVIA